MSVPKKKKQQKVLIRLVSYGFYLEGTVRMDTLM